MIPKLVFLSGAPTGSAMFNLTNEDEIYLYGYLDGFSGISLKIPSARFRIKLPKARFKIKLPPAAKFRVDIGRAVEAYSAGSKKALKSMMSAITEPVLETVSTVASSATEIIQQNPELAQAIAPVADAFMPGSGQILSRMASSTASEPAQPVSQQYPVFMPAQPASAQRQVEPLPPAPVQMDYMQYLPYAAIAGIGLIILLRRKKR